MNLSTGTKITSVGALLSAIFATIFTDVVKGLYKGFGLDNRVELAAKDFAPNLEDSSVHVASAQKAVEAVVPETAPATNDSVAVQPQPAPAPITTKPDQSLETETARRAEIAIEKLEQIRAMGDEEQSLKSEVLKTFNECAHDENAIDKVREYCRSYLSKMDDIGG